MAELTDEEFRAALEGVLVRSRLSRRGLSAAMGRDRGYVAALLDPGRPSRARPTPADLLSLSNATGMPLAELLESLWGIPRWRLARGRGLQHAATDLEDVLAKLDQPSRRTVMEFAAFLAERQGARQSRSSSSGGGTGSS